MDSFTTCVYKLIWQLLHYLVCLYELILWLHLRINAFALWSYDLCRSHTNREQNEYDFLQQCKNHLNKIPKHLNVIIGPQSSRANDELLRRIFTYALHMNINCVSYYDTRYTNPISNSSKSCLSPLEKLNCPRGWRRKNIDRHHSVWYIFKDEAIIDEIKLPMNGTSHASNSTSNGHLPNSLTKTSVLEIYEIKPQNNHPLIAQICRDLFRQRHTADIQKLLDHRSSLTERLSKELAKHLGNLAEPELSIVFNENICTFGLLPWHTRFTEFHRCPNDQHFDVKAFANILYKYSRCEQRWGK